MKSRNLWYTLSLVNLCIVALLGMTLRSKLLFPLTFIDYKNFLSAHSHFAFGGWVTLALMILFIDNLLTEEQKKKNIYQWILWGIEITSFGMVITFPFQGYALFSIIFSTFFIFFTYAFSWQFIKDIRKTKKEKPVTLLGIAALASLVISSIGPFTLAYILATHTGNAILYRDSIYTYLHFQYNGFFTLSVFTLFFNAVINKIGDNERKRIKLFAILLCISVLPSLFLSLLWHAFNIYIRTLAIVGCSLIFLTVAAFLTFAGNGKLYTVYSSSLARSLLKLSMASFVIKMLLQMGTIIPVLGNAVFGLRPIIIGFLHLVFLGLVSFYILSNFFNDKILSSENRISKIAIIFFSVAVIVNEGILLIDGLGRLLYFTHPVYFWLLWIAAILLFFGALLILIARLWTPIDSRAIKELPFKPVAPL